MINCQRMRHRADRDSESEGTEIEIDRWTFRIDGLSCS